MNGMSGQPVGIVTDTELRQLLQRCHWIAASRGQGPPATIFGIGFQVFLDRLLVAGALRRSTHFSGFAVCDHVDRVAVYRDGSVVVLP